MKEALQKQAIEENATTEAEKKNYGADSVQIRKYPGERPGWDFLDFSPHAISNFWWIREYIRR